MIRLCLLVVKIALSLNVNSLIPPNQAICHWEIVLHIFLSGNVYTGVKEVIITGQSKGTMDHIGHTGHVLALAVTTDGKYLVNAVYCLYLAIVETLYTVYT